MPGVAQLAPRHSAGDGDKPTVEGLTTLLGELAHERQELRANGADRRALERNRLAIVAAQWQFSHALIERHVRPFEQPQAA
jgi:hypothetical protein